MFIQLKIIKGQTFLQNHEMFDQKKIVRDKKKENNKGDIFFVFDFYF